MLEYGTRVEVADDFGNFLCKIFGTLVERPPQANGIVPGGAVWVRLDHKAEPVWKMPDDLRPAEQAPALAEPEQLSEERAWAVGDPALDGGEFAIIDQPIFAEIVEADGETRAVIRAEAAIPSASAAADPAEPQRKRLDRSEEHHQRFLDDWLRRFEAAVEQMNSKQKRAEENG